jgi:hypothetical protein
MQIDLAYLNAGGLLLMRPYLTGNHTVLLCLLDLEVSIQRSP